jgi:hypothetical protein
MNSEVMKLLETRTDLFLSLVYHSVPQKVLENEKYKSNFVKPNVENIIDCYETNPPH